METVRALAAKLEERGIAVAVDLIYRMDALDAGAIFTQNLQQLLGIDFDISQPELQLRRYKER